MHVFVRVTSVFCRRAEVACVHVGACAHTSTGKALSGLEISTVIHINPKHKVPLANNVVLGVPHKMVWMSRQILWRSALSSPTAPLRL